MGDLPQGYDGQRAIAVPVPRVPLPLGPERAGTRGEKRLRACTIEGFAQAPPSYYAARRSSRATTRRAGLSRTLTGPRRKLHALLATEMWHCFDGPEGTNPMMLRNPRSAILPDQ